MPKVKKPRTSEEIAVEINKNASNISTPKAKTKPVAPKKAAFSTETPKVVETKSVIKAAPPVKKEEVIGATVAELPNTTPLEESTNVSTKKKAPHPRTKNASSITQNQVVPRKTVHNTATNMIGKPKFVETKQEVIDKPTTITYTFTEKEMTSLVSAIVEGLSAQFVTKDEAAKVVIGTLSKIAMKDVPDEVVTNSIENTTDYVAPTTQEESVKKEGIFSKFFKRKGNGAS